MAMHNITKQLSDLAIPLSNLEALPVNPRDGNVPAIMASFEAFGQLKPIVWRLQTVEGHDKRRRVVIAGNHMVQAARNLGWTQIAGVDATGMSDEEALAFAVADNRTSELGTTDQRALAEYMQQADLTPEQWTGAFFTDDELNQYLTAMTSTQFDGFLDDAIGGEVEAFSANKEEPLDVELASDLVEFMVFMTVAQKRETTQTLMALKQASDALNVGEVLYNLVRSHAT